MITKTFNKKVSKEKTDHFVIPAGVLEITEWSVGCEFFPNSSLKGILYYVKDGDRKKNNWKILDRIYTKQGNYKKTLSTPIVVTSEGSAEIVLKASVLGKHGNREVFMQWVGDLY